MCVLEILLDKCMNIVEVMKLCCIIRIILIGGKLNFWKSLYKYF